MHEFYTRFNAPSCPRFTAPPAVQSEQACPSENEGTLSPCLPRQRVSSPLQRPDRRHSRTAEPLKTYPGLQLKMADAPNVCWVPIFLPFGGVGRSPQEITMVRCEGRKEMKNRTERAGERRLPYIFKVNARAATHAFRCDLNAISLTCNISGGL